MISPLIATGQYMPADVPSTVAAFGTGVSAAQPVKPHLERAAARLADTVNFETTRKMQICQGPLDLPYKSKRQEFRE